MKLIVFLVLVLVPCSLGCLNCQRRKTCDTGWTQINRTLGGWCVKWISTPFTYTAYATATNTCIEAGAVLSSIESQAEFEIAVGLHQNASALDTFLGSQLTSACNCPDPSEFYDECNTTATCSFPTAFEWTDNFTVGTAVFDEQQDLYDYQGDTLQYGQYLVIFGTSLTDSTDNQVTTQENYRETINIGAYCGKRLS